MRQASFCKYQLQFKTPSGTSRGVLKTKDSYFIKLWNTNVPSIFGLGECSLISGLSFDDLERLPSVIEKACSEPEVWDITYINSLNDFPALQMALQMALIDLEKGGERQLFHSSFIKKKAPQKINGLIWMGNKQFMLKQVESKLEQGFDCLKLKIGAIQFDEELEILKSIRHRFDGETLEIRVDANGAFAPKEAYDKIMQLAKFDLHSIEQPIAAGQIEQMSQLCKVTPLPIALDEELIGPRSFIEKQQLIEIIQPQYIILKPSLLGGFAQTNEWIAIAGETSTPWWITSALESNIGLSAIAQYVAQFHNPLPQGLGTGQLFTNNIPSPLTLESQFLKYDTDKHWNFSQFSQCG